jgi:hypothetical protein
MTPTVPKSVEAARRLVEGDEVLFISGAMGTPGNIAAQKYMNARKVPQLFLAAAAGKLSDPATNPWTMVSGTTYEMEGAVVGRYIADTFAEAKIAVIYQNDDAGKATLAGLKSGLGSRASRIVSELNYSVSRDSCGSCRCAGFGRRKTDHCRFRSATYPRYLTRARSSQMLVRAREGLSQRPLQTNRPQ